MIANYTFQFLHQKSGTFLLFFQDDERAKRFSVSTWTEGCKMGEFDTNKKVGNAFQWRKMVLLWGNKWKIKQRKMEN